MINILKSLLVLAVTMNTAIASPQFAIGIDEYVEVGGNGYSIRSADDYQILAITRSYHDFSFGVGYGNFYHTFGARGGFNEKKSTEEAFALIGEYHKSFFFVNVVVAKPHHEIERTRSVVSGTRIINGVTLPAYSQESIESDHHETEFIFSAGFKLTIE